MSEYIKLFMWWNNMLTGFLINIIFLQLFFIYYNWEKKQEQEAFARAKFRAELQEIIEEAFKEIKLDYTWETTKSDALLDYYIECSEKLNDEK